MYYRQPTDTASTPLAQRQEKHVHQPMPDASATIRHLDSLYTDSALDDAQLRSHLADDHGAHIYEDDDRESLGDVHAALHRVAMTEPPASAQAEEVPEVRAARAEVELYRLKQAELAYDVDMPSTLRERMAYARSLAASGLIPKAFRSGRGGEDGMRETTANVLLAVELGGTMGLHPLQALVQVNVVEGKPGLGAEAQLAQVLQAGHDIYVDEDRSDRTKATVVAQRTGQDRVHTFVYTLDDAVAAGLCRIVEDKPYARSSSGKPLPWETSTPDMLVWRAVTRCCKRLFPDVVGGLASVDDEPGTQYGQGVASAAAAPAAPARATRATADTDSVEADLALFTEDTGPWWEHAGATVRRRSKLQLAADRLADALAAGDDRVPSPRQGSATMADAIVDAELVDDGPAVAEPTDAPPAEPTEPATEVVVDGAAEAQELERHLASVPADTVPAEVEDPPSDPWEDTSTGDPLPDQGTPAAQAEVPLDRAELWAQVEALAQQRGKTVAQLMARHVLATRVNPEDMTAEQLQAYLSAQQGL